MVAIRLALAAIMSLSICGAANAEQAEHLAAAMSKLAETHVTNYTVVFDHPEAVLSERRPIGSALSLVADFLAEREFPSPKSLPRVEFVSPAQIAAVRYRGVGSGARAALVQQGECAGHDLRRCARGHLSVGVVDRRIASGAVDASSWVGLRWTTGGRVDLRLHSRAGTGCRPGTRGLAQAVPPDCEGNFRCRRGGVHADHPVPSLTSDRIVTDRIRIGAVSSACGP